MLIVRQRGGRFLRRVGEDGSENVHGQLLFEAGDERAEKKTAQALREGLDVRDKTRNLKGRFSHQEKVDDDKEMSVEHQESLNEGSVVAWQEGQEMAMLSKSKNPQSTQDLRECLYLKTTPIALKEHVSHQGKAGDSDRMAAECQEPHDEGAAKVLRWGEAPARTIGGTNTQTTRYGNDNCKEYYQTEKLCDGWPSSSTGRRADTSVTLPPGLESSLLKQPWKTAVSPIVNHSKKLTQNDPFPNAFSPHASFRSGQGLLVAVCPGALPCSPFFIGPIQQHYNSNGGCNGPMICNTAPPPSCNNDRKLSLVNPQSSPAVLGSTLLSSYATHHQGNSDWTNQGRPRRHSFDDGNSFDGGGGFPPPLPSNIDFADFFVTPDMDATSSSDDGNVALSQQETSNLHEG